MHMHNYRPWYSIISMAMHKDSYPIYYVVPISITPGADLDDYFGEVVILTHVKF